jgi:paraquat-inducible protein A
LSYLFIGLEIIAAGVLLFLAWVKPIMSVQTWIFFYKDVSIFDVTQQLYEDEFLVLAGLVFVFAIIFPGVKLLVMGRAWAQLWAEDGTARFGPSLKLFDVMGKWSMLDVFIVAVVIVGMQSSFVNDVELYPGIYYFAASVLISMLAIYDLRRVNERRETLEAV